ncbi:hypothetical protein TSAR_011815 [Trichomalopsis sarcophagae]|uniref:C2H2-type domain-containing protein n=1 Tax=Trichomalopsis sarcophagae TaxID=543379 RepID=A0A232F5Y8_9HYME|nr:hypothetical protein TSAR_011815 [Trichomalopsis sarcophagae]
MYLADPLALHPNHLLAPKYRHTVINPGLQCQQCGKSYSHRHNLLKHINHECGGQRHFICSICQMRFTQKISLQRHLRCKHNIDTKRLKRRNLI